MWKFNEFVMHLPAIKYHCSQSTICERRAHFLRESILSGNPERQKTSSRMYPTFNHHSLSPFSKGKLWQPVWISPTWKGNVSGSIVKKKWQTFPTHHANYVFSLNDPLLKTKLFFWREKKCILLYRLIFPIHWPHWYIHSADYSGQLKNGCAGSGDN